jgi:N-acetylglutamate synthase-like GNAT family acetyltransferase
MIIRALEKKDIESVEEIFDLYWDDEFRKKLSRKLADYTNNSSEILEQDFKFFVAEEKEEIVGVSAIRRLPEHMKEYAQTERPAELYVIAVKYKNMGIGKLLREIRIEEAKKSGYTELLFFSSEKHKDSWPFHDNSGFKRVTSSVAPNGESGFIWRLKL